MLTAATPTPRGTGSTADHSQFPILQRDFTSGPEVTAACLTCHINADDEIMKSIHFTWKFDNPETGQELGKRFVVNSFCGAVAGNEVRCTACHIGYGWDDMSTPPPTQSAVGTGWDSVLPKPTLDLEKPTLDLEAPTFDLEKNKMAQNNAVDCLICHADPDIYTKATTLAGHPALYPVPEGMRTITGREAWAVDLRKAALSVGMPERQNCAACHFYGGGGDNVKHGDLSSALYNPTKDIDVHMDAEGLNFTCSTCHITENHLWPGSRYAMTAVDPHGIGKPGQPRQVATCASCHTDTPHPMTSLTGMTLNDHTDKVACQTCHIPEFARGGVATRTHWDWSTAGRLENGMPIKLSEFTQSDGRDLYTYLSTKGDLAYAENVVPYYSWFDGQLEHTLLGDKIDPSQVVDINRVGGAEGGPDTRIWPFKRMTGRQPFDSVKNELVVTQVWGPETDTAFWTNFDWTKAIGAGMAAAGQEFSGEHGFVDTQMHWPITHMVAPAANALTCAECHTPNGRMEGIPGIHLAGSNPFSFTGLLGMAMVLASLLGVLGHGLLRRYAKKGGGKRHE